MICIDRSFVMWSLSTESNCRFDTCPQTASNPYPLPSSIEYSSFQFVPIERCGNARSIDKANDSSSVSQFRANFVLHTEWLSTAIYLLRRPSNFFDSTMASNNPTTFWNCHEWIILRSNGTWEEYKIVVTLRIRLPYVVHSVLPSKLQTNWFWTLCR